MTYKDIILYVMSGTGNTFRLAHWMKEIADLRGTETEVVMIDDVTSENLNQHQSNRLVGILFPAHGLIVPWSMLKFLFRLPRGRRIPAICGATRGGIKTGRLIIPGAVGAGVFIAAFILTLKGYRVKAMFSLDMPVNFINLHWGMHPKNVAFLLSRTRHKLEPIMTKILDGKRIYFTLNNLWELAWSTLMFWAVPVLPIFYLFMARIWMGKLMFSNNRCIGCGLCAKFCSNHGVIMKEIGEKKRPYWTYHCEACLRCMGFCKKKAIEAGHSWAILLYFITSVPVFTWLSIRLHAEFPVFPIIQNYWLSELFNLIYLFPAMMLSYWIFWYLIKIPIVNTVFTFTTLTHFFRRYHEPETKLKNFKRGKKKS
ncbi:EFR1 family ferrodoxin [bacterium]|nr:EFR1 family ferrodoxin [bacterium]